MKILRFVLSVISGTWKEEQCYETTKPARPLPCLAETGKACESLLLPADLHSTNNGLVTLRPAERDLCSLGSLPTTKIQGKQKALVLALVAHLGGQNDDCDVSCLLRGKLTTGSPLIPLS